ncbi:hypothetical protein P8452_59340 [Trifolium repens]|nr:hypothetical protein P8452_59340 [Trifolium repens]
MAPLHKSFESSSINETCSITAKPHSENSNPSLGNRMNPFHYKPRNHLSPGTLTLYVFPMAQKEFVDSIFLQNYFISY